MLNRDVIMQDAVGETADGTAIDVKGLSLNQILNSIERLIIVDSIKGNEYDLDKVAKSLKVSKQSLLKKVERFGIAIDKK